MTELAVHQSYYPGIFVARIINAVAGIIEVTLAIRIVLELFGASPASSFVAWIYSLTAAIMAPFTGAFPGLTIGYGSSIDLVAILAMIGYAILGWLFIRLLAFIFTSINVV